MPGLLLLVAVPLARQTYTLTYDPNAGTMLLVGEPAVGRELIGSLATSLPVSQWIFNAANSYTSPHYPQVPGTGPRPGACGSNLALCQ